MSNNESPFIIAKHVNTAFGRDLNLDESQNRQSPRKANPKKSGAIPAIALITIGRVKVIVRVMREY